MPFQILPNDKFGVVALVRVSKADFPSPLDLGGGLWVLNGAPFDVGQIWRKWIGSIHADRIADANLWFVATRPSKTPEVDDQENRELKDEVWHLFLGLLVIGSPYYEGGYILTGAHVDGTPGVRQYSEIHQYLVSYGAQHLTVDQTDIQSALQIKAGLRRVYQNRTHKRLQRGTGVFIRGLKEDFAVARLHQFVRSVEAVVKPRPPRIKEKFIRRCRTFVGGTPAAGAIIGECYELRSKEEHLLDWQDALFQYAHGQRENVLFQRVRQIESLCRHVYQRALTSAQHQADFEDVSIDGFWGRPEPDRATRWGAPLNIAAVP